jgi:DNA-directed RNA polymerase subunit RPC12/RpoP
VLSGSQEEELSQLVLTDQDKLILIGILASVMVLVLYFELKVMRGKTKDAQKRSQRKDEVYNSILTTRSVMNVLERQGKDVSAAKSELALAKDAMTRGEYESSNRHCEKAKEELTKVRATPAPTRRLARTDEDQKDSLEVVAESILIASKATPPSADGYKGSKLSDDKGVNYMGAKFELNAARAEVSKAAADGYDVFKAERFIQEADACFAAGDYTRALSLALKARKLLGSDDSTETIPLHAPTEEHVPEPPSDVEEVEEIESASGRCHRCGSPFHSDDAFCPKCGAKVMTEKKCPGCGSEPREGDVFCRKCGSRIP